MDRNVGTILHYYEDKMTLDRNEFAVINNGYNHQGIDYTIN
jgi:hypothetical protein